MTSTRKHGTTERGRFEERARRYFGDNNTKTMTAVHLATDTVMLIEGERLWIYSEPYGMARGARGLSLRLTPTRRQALLSALEEAA